MRIICLVLFVLLTACSSTVLVRSRAYANTDEAINTIRQVIDYNRQLQMMVSGRKYNMGITHFEMNQQFMQFSALQQQGKVKHYGAITSETNHRLSKIQFGHIYLSHKKGQFRLGVFDIGHQFTAVFIVNNRNDAERLYTALGAWTGAELHQIIE